MSNDVSFVEKIKKNVPNILSAIRLALVPVFVFLYFSEYENGKVWSIIVYVGAVFTDVLDGYIARHFNLITNLGRILDPLADKLMSLTVLTCITITKILPVWLTVAMFVKELLMLSGGTFIHKKVRVDMPPSNIFGKAATVAIFVLCASIMIFENISRGVITALIVIVISLAVLALASYIRTYINIVNKKNKKA